MNPHFFTALFYFAFICFHLVQGSRFRALVAASPPFFRRWYSRIAAFPLGNAYKGSQSPVISLISGEWIVSHAWHEILRLSPHLFWLGLFPHGAFSSAQDDDTRGRKDSQAGGISGFLKDGILVSQPSPLGEGARKGRIG